LYHNKDSIFSLLFFTRNSFLIMSIAEVKENVINLMNTIARRSDSIERMNGSKSLIEIDLAMEDIRILYRELDRLRKFTEVESMSGSTISRERASSAIRPQSPHPVSNESDFQPQIHSSEPKPSAQVFAEKPADKVTAVPVEKKQDEKPDAEPLVVNRTSPINETAKNVEIPQAEIKQQATKTQQVAQTPTNHLDSPLPVVNESAPPTRSEDNKKTLVGERYSTDKGSVHERLAQIRDDKSIGMRMQSKPVANIKDAIGLNEKFLFINELFGGDISAYNNAITDLNSRASIHDAFEMLNNLTEEYKWDGQRSAETIEKFANLVQRRYMA
jgi:hypothetical protein